MKLPRPIFDLVKKAFRHHGCWHYLRMDDSLQGEAQRRKCFPPCEMWPDGLHSFREKGCGEEFLKFHRMMIRNFKWIVNSAPVPKYWYSPWEKFPCWVESKIDVLDPFYLRKLNHRLGSLVSGGSLDELGRFIEGDTLRGSSADTSPDVHSKIHGIVHDYEQTNFGRQDDSDMGNADTAACNEHFWRLHGWIDEVYVRWEHANGETPNQSPLEPMPMGMCDECNQKFDCDSTWLVKWHTYLKSRGVNSVETNPAQD
jgi:hypothetical protein